jgi:hypothetical protein
MEVGRKLSFGESIAGALLAGLGYVFFYELNGWMFSQVKISDNISWVFLPAAIRMLAVLLFEWAGVAGLFAGSLAVIFHLLADEPGHALALATLSSVPSLLAARFVQRSLGIQADLAGMTGRHLLVFGLAGGLVNSLSHTLYFASRDGSLAPLHGFIPMFIGDSIGTLLVLYAGAITLRHFRPRPSSE